MSSWQTSRGHSLLHGGFTPGMANGQLVVEGLDETLRKIDQMSTKHPNMDKVLKKITRKALQKVARMTRSDAKGIVGKGYPNSGGDPREAYRAVKSMVYKRILGGNVSILSKRKHGNSAATLPKNGGTVIDKHGQHRGGNKRKRSPKTENVMRYWGADRAFILRFLNAGTKKRHISTRNNKNVNRFVGRGHTSASLNSKRNGNRGSIIARNWFGNSSMENMEEVMLQIHIELEELISEMWEGDTIASAESINFDSSYFG